MQEPGGLMTARDGAALRLIERLEHDSDAGSVARELVLQLLATRPTTDELRHDAALVAYELVANAVMHGHPEADGTVELVCELVGDQLLVRVRDAGSQGTVEPIALAPEAGNGRAWPSWTHCPAPGRWTGPTAPSSRRGFRWPGDRRAANDRSQSPSVVT